MSTLNEGTKVSSGWWGGGEKTTSLGFGEWESVVANGVQINQPHTGVDIPMPSGTTLMVPTHATVDDAGTDEYGNNFVRLMMDNGQQVLLLHLQDVLVRAGQDLAPGATLGHSGSSGLSTGPHLHFEVDQGGKPIDPTYWLTLVPKALGAGAERNPYNAVDPRAGWWELSHTPALVAAGKVGGFLTKKQNWWRAGFISIGVVLIGVGVIVYFFKEESETVEHVAPVAAAA